MKKQIYKISFIICVIFFVLLISNTISNAASFDASISNRNVKVGDTFTITVKANNAAGNYSVSTTNSNVVLTKGSATEFLENGSTTLTYKAITAGTVDIIAKATDMTDLDNSSIPVTGSKTFTVTITQPTTNPPTNGSTGGSTGGNNSGTTTDKPTVTEPKFTSASKTVYATGDINLRSSWSTSSNATKVAKGTELRLTGTSTEKVNGYVWYRVTYNGQAKYVSRDLITETKPEENEEKSNNTNLKALTIEGVELIPAFSADVTQYSAKLANYTESSLKINAEVEDAKSTVKIEGNEEIKLGENVITATVTAEDGTTKTYKIIVTNEEKEGLGLSSLVIKDIELKDFSPSKFNYEIEFKELDKLEIEAIANEEGATVEIIGNENLVEGENIITIIVTSADEEQIATYTITATKLAVEGQKQELNIKSILICALIALVVLVAIIILIVRYVKGNSGAEVDYVYNDNLENKDEDDNETKEEIEIEKEVEQVEQRQEEKNKKPTIDDLYADYDDKPTKKRGKGRHSK